VINVLVRDSLLRALGAAKLHCVRRIERDRLAALIRSLRPVRGDAPLIRIGPAGAGGYLVPDDLEGIEFACLAGVSTDSGFAADLASRGIGVFFSESVGSPAQSGDQIESHTQRLSGFSDAAQMTLDHWKQDTIGDTSGDLLLQMDIEGGEFETLLCVSDSLLRQFRILVIDFHHLHQLWNKPWFLLVEHMFQKLLRTHSVVHIHPNNCCRSFSSADLEIPRIAEFTFYRNDRIGHRAFCGTFPHPLDADNTRRRTLALPGCWYR